jgi:Na+/phosphate symporter
MATPVPATTPATLAPKVNSTTNQPAAKTGIGGSIRIVISIVVAVAIGIFGLLWNGNFIPNPGAIPLWVGNTVFISILAVVLSFGSNSLVQQLSCGQVQLGTQAMRLLFVPIPFVLLWVLLYFIPSLRWPIEGLVQGQPEDLRRGLSSGFYTFWIALYTQSIMNGLSQICPK